MTAKVGLMLAANVVVTLAAGALARKLSEGRPLLSLSVWILVRQLLISVLVLAAGLGGFLTPLGLGIACAALFVVLFLSRAHLRLPVLAGPRPGPLCAALLTAVAVRLLLQVWITAPHLGDPLAYHLPKIGEWIREGGFTRELGAHSHVTFPAGFELIETWWVVFLRHDVLIEMAGVEFALLAFAATHALGRSLGLDENAASSAGLLFVLVPGFHSSVTSCLNDAPAAALVLVTFALLSGNAPWPLVAAAAGLGLGIKPTYGFALSGAMCFAWMIRGREPRLARASAVSVAVAAAALGAGAFWYLRNLSWFGNPFYPLGTPGYENPTPVQFGPRGASLIANLVSLVDLRIYDAASVYGANVDHMAGWGPVAFACGSVALVGWLKDDARSRPFAISLAVSLLVSLAFVQNDPWCLKYVFFFPALFCVAAARLAAACRATAVLSSVAALTCFAGTFFAYDFRASHALTLLDMPWGQRSASVFPHGQIRGVLPDGPIGYFGATTGAAYLLYGPDFSRSVAYLRASSAPGLAAEAAGRGVREIFCPRPTPAQQAILDECVSRGLLRRSRSPFFEVAQPGAKRN